MNLSRTAHLAACLMLAGLGWSHANAQLLSEYMAELEATEGAMDETTGARVESVEEMEDNTYKVTVSIPDQGENDVDEVIVVGSRQDVNLFKKDEDADPGKLNVINDLDSGRRGVVVQLNERSNFVLKFNYHEDDGFPPPPRSGPSP